MELNGFKTVKYSFIPEAELNPYRNNFGKDATIIVYDLLQINNFFQ